VQGCPASHPIHESQRVEVATHDLRDASVTEEVDAGGGGYYRPAKHLKQCERVTGWRDRVSQYDAVHMCVRVRVRVRVCVCDRE
jgi:hypothetical protein